MRSTTRRRTATQAMGVGLLMLAGCGGGGDDTTTDTQDEPVIDADPSAPDADPGALDAALGSPDASPHALPVPDRGIRLAYLATPAASPTAQLDVCIRRTDADPWIRLYQGTAGIGHGEVGRYMPIDGLGAWRIELIDATGECGGAFLYGTNHVIDNDSVVKRMTLTYVLAGGVVAEFRYTRFVAADVVGIDLLAAMDGVDGGVAIRFDDGVEQESLTGSGAVLPAGTTGNVEVDIEDAAGTELFPYQAGDGVGTMAFVTGAPNAAQVLYCDELTPTVGPLAHCSPTLRSP